MPKILLKNIIGIIITHDNHTKFEVSLHFWQIWPNVCQRGWAVCATMALFVLFLLYAISGPETFQLYADNIFVAKSLVDNWATLVPFTCTCKHKY